VLPATAIAFLSVLHAPAEPKAAKAEQPAADASASDETAPADSAPTAAPQVVEVGLTLAVEAVVQGVQQGLLEADEITLLRAALAARRSATPLAQETPYVALSGARP